MALTDKQLLNKARQGDKASMRAIYLAHKDHLFTIARAILHDRHLAEDVVHDVFVAFARRLQELRLRTTLKAYLSVGVCNRARDVIRARVRRQGKLDAASGPPEPTLSPDAEVSQQEALAQLRDALQRVPIEQREVLLLRTRAGLSFREIARQQGIAVNTAQGRYRYGLNKLKMLMQNGVHATSLGPSSEDVKRKNG